MTLLARVRSCRACTEPGHFQTGAGAWFCRRCISQLCEYLDFLSQESKR